jgi:hypothetical protein
MKYLARCIIDNTRCSKTIFYLSHEVFFDPYQILSAPRGWSVSASTDHLAGTSADVSSGRKTIRATFVIARMQFVRRTVRKASHYGKKKARRDHAWRAAAGA